MANNFSTNSRLNTTAKKLFKISMYLYCASSLGNCSSDIVKVLIKIQVVMKASN